VVAAEKKHQLPVDHSLNLSARLPIGFWLALAAGLVLRAWYFSDLVSQPWFG
jgi:hypothetical protein